MRVCENGLCYYLYTIPGEWVLEQADDLNLTRSKQGFGLTIGSDLYLVINPEARRVDAGTDRAETETYHGHIIGNNASLPLSELGGTFSFMDVGQTTAHVFKG